MRVKVGNRLTLSYKNKPGKEDEVTVTKSDGFYEVFEVDIDECDELGLIAIGTKGNYYWVYDPRKEPDEKWKHDT